MKSKNIYRLNKLHELLVPWILECPTNIVLTDLKLDSRKIMSGDLFIAIKGHKTDGRLYINEAVKNGASAILLEFGNNDKLLTSSFHGYVVDGLIPFIYVNKLKKNISYISSRFYGYPSLFLSLVGVTGTNGKTTITHLLSNWVKLLGKTSAVMGTIGHGILNDMHASFNTTCSAVDIQKILSRFVQNRIEFVAMEVSSHGLDQYRVDALYFNVVIFSNLSHEHLDYHHNMNNYELVKWRLFSELHSEFYVINADDNVGLKWLQQLPRELVVAVTNKILPNNLAGKWIYVVEVNYHRYGTDIVFNSSWGNGIINSKLLGSFNVKNLLLALGALLIMGYPLKWLLKTASQLMPVIGRMEMLRFFQHPMVMIDYAHTPDALRQVLSIMKKLYSGNLWCIFGCGGDRDRSKRMLMGAIAEQYSNHVILTNDNPRTENPMSIIDDIISGMNDPKKIEIIEDRASAIKKAIALANPEDCVIIFGKGHEKYQIIGEEYIDYSDHDIVRDLLPNFL